MTMLDPEQHLHNPILAGLDVVSAVSIIGYWMDFLTHPIAVIGSFFAATWYAILIYEFIERRLKRDRK